ncbi:hypothetical protein [Pseudomonas sp. MYb118]|uniref:hypothetical protein n=1 Tax=Pseudomonas sp. MYb118 TaxID=1848720 RepID=UPI0034CE8DBC
MAKNNPTGQLLDLMTAAREQGHNQHTIEALSTVFACKADDSISVARGILYAINLCAQARAATEKFIPGNKAIFLAPFDKIEGLFSRMNLLAAWSTYQPYISDSVIAALTFGDHSLSLTYAGESPETPQDIRDFISRLDVLLDECLASELAPELKALFLRHLESLRSALLEYRLNGSVSLEKALDEIAGSMARHQSTVGREYESGNIFIKGFFETLGKINDLVSTGQNIYLLGAPAAPLLLSVLNNV